MGVIVNTARRHLNNLQRDTETVRRELRDLQARFPGVDVGVVAAEEMLAGNIGDGDRGETAVFVLTGRCLPVLPRPAPGVITAEAA